MGAGKYPATYRTSLLYERGIFLGGGGEVDDVEDPEVRVQVIQGQGSTGVVVHANGGGVD